jgi:hypothetical protein
MKSLCAWVDVELLVIWLAISECWDLLPPIPPETQAGLAMLKLKSVGERKNWLRVWIIKGVIETNVMNERQQLASWTSIYQICHTGIIFARNTRKGFKTIISFFHMGSNSLLPKETSDDKKWSKPMSLPSVIQMRRSVVPCCRSFHSHTILGMVYNCLLREHVHSSKKLLHQTH